MSFYSELGEDVDDILEEFGQSVSVTNFEMGVETPSTGAVTQASSQFTTVGVLLDYDYRNFGDGTNPYHVTTSADKRLLLSAASVVNSGDLLLVDNVFYKAFVIKTVNPAGTRVLYDIWMKK